MQKAYREEIRNGWHFLRGAAKRYERLDHDTVYAMTKAGQEVGDMEIFLRDNDWKKVSVPHDWSTMDQSDPAGIPDNGFKLRGEGWYYNEIQVPFFEEDSPVFLTFEGVMGHSTVYVNGVLVKRNVSGYTAFRMEISDYLVPGEAAMVVVHVDNTEFEGWWYEGAGIYRPVWLSVLPPVYLVEDGLYVWAQPEDENDLGGTWQVTAEAEVQNTLSEAFQGELIFRLYDAQRQICAEGKESIAVPAGEKHKAVHRISITAPKLWELDDPSLYSAEVSLQSAEETCQSQKTALGFRSIRWTDHGMYLNGRKTPVRGICCHQDHAGVGTAVTRSLLRYRIAKLKQMGCNAYRCAHHCPSRELLEVCDEYGLLVMAENRHYRSTEEVMEQLDELTRLSRSHPSVFLYSLFNEEPWQAERRGRRMAEKMLKRIRMNDPLTPVTAAMNGGVLTRENASDVLDVAGMNYWIEDYNTYAKRRPGHPMIGTENGPLYATRGIYRDDQEKQLFNSYGLTTAWFGNTLQDTMEAAEGAPHVAGVFVWGGFDYRGEPQPFEWPSVFSHWGLTDNCGFEKDTFWMLKSYYSDEDDLMLHLLPHWNWIEGETVRVCAMTNCDTVQLFVNGKPMEEKTVVRRRAEWEVPFAPGAIRAVAKKGDRVLEETVETTGKASAIRVEDAAPDDRYDSSILNVTLVDAAGRIVPTQAPDRTVTFDVERGTLIGAGNGDPNGIQPDITNALPTFCGKCQAIVLPDDEGVVRVRVTAEGLAPVTVERKIPATE
ncbi:MAG: DUF4982 domain-containing protein [Clostridia bacterium]|nr:DUF4982 domain-containing protein [Clostridia bacterium]